MVIPSFIVVSADVTSTTTVMATTKQSNRPSSKPEVLFNLYDVHLEVPRGVSSPKT